MKPATKIDISEVFVRLLLVFILMVVAQSVLATSDVYSSDSLSSPNTELQVSLLQSKVTTQKASNGLILCKVSIEDSVSCCVHCCSCQIFFFEGSPTFKKTGDNNLNYKQETSVFLEGIITIPFRPPRTESSVRY